MSALREEGRERGADHLSGGGGGGRPRGGGGGGEILKVLVGGEAWILR